MLEGYAAASHILWFKGTLPGIHPKSMTSYVNTRKLRFEDRYGKDEAYADLDKFWCEGCIRNMFTLMQSFNQMAILTGVALKESVLEWLAQKIIEQLHSVDLTGKTNQEIISIITNVGWTAETWEAARKHFGLKATVKSYDRKFSKHVTFDQRSQRMDE